MGYFISNGDNIIVNVPYMEAYLCPLSIPVICPCSYTVKMVSYYL